MSSAVMELTVGDWPTEKEMMDFLGKEAGSLWKTLAEYLAENYDHVATKKPDDNRLEGTIRYRRGGKTLVTLYPKEGELTVLIILGRKEVEKFRTERNEFSPDIIELFKNTKQYHDGRWLHIKVPGPGTLEDIKKLLHLKKKPSRRK
ncbi:MAG: DUF3788 family protein [Candidatus Thorarchaeota archaeon SMTZ1-83]